MPSVENRDYSSYSGYFNNTSETIVINAICPACHRNYALEYDLTHQLIEYNQMPEVELDLPQEISSISASFVNIYKQSLIAELYYLHEIAGVGFRKSIEFLVKDYAISKATSDEEIEQIKSSWLGKVITDYLADYPKLQTLATAGTWIGNDETHYVKIHQDKDIDDLKNFIRAAATFIAADIQADNGLNFITR